jgi:hypothetical protein
MKVPLRPGAPHLGPPLREQRAAQDVDEVVAHERRGPVDVREAHGDDRHPPRVEPRGLLGQVLAQDVAVLVRVDGRVLGHGQRDLLVVVDQDRREVDELPDGPLLELLQGLHQRHQVIVESGGLAARDRLPLQAVVVGIADDVDDLVEGHVLQGVQVGQAGHRDVAVGRGRRVPSHRDHLGAHLQDVGPEEAAAAEEDGPGPGPGAHGQTISPWKPRARSFGSISSR